MIRFGLITVIFFSSFTALIQGLRRYYQKEEAICILMGYTLFDMEGNQYERPEYYENIQHSPDGKLRAYFDGSQLVLQSRENGHRQFIWEANTQYPPEIFWSNDSQFFALSYIRSASYSTASGYVYNDIGWLLFSRDGRLQQTVPLTGIKPYFHQWIGQYYLIAGERYGTDILFLMDGSTITEIPLEKDLTGYYSISGNRLLMTFDNGGIIFDASQKRLDYYTLPLPITNHADNIIWSPDGDYFVHQHISTGITRSFVISLDNLQMMYELENGIEIQSWNKQWLVYNYNLPSALKVLAAYHVQTGEQVIFTDQAKEGRVNGNMAVIVQDDRLHMINLDTREITPLFDMGGEFYNASWYGDILYIVEVLWNSAQYRYHFIRQSHHFYIDLAPFSFSGLNALNQALFKIPSLTLIDAGMGEEVASFEILPGYIVFTQQNQNAWLIVIHNDTEHVFYKIEKNTLSKISTLPTDTILNAAFSPQADQFAIVYKQGNNYALDVIDWDGQQHRQIASSIEFTSPQWQPCQPAYKN